MHTSWKHLLRPPSIPAYLPLIVLLLLRISLCLCLSPASSVQLINSNELSEERSTNSKVEVIKLDHAIGRKDAAQAFRASGDELINSEWCAIYIFINDLINIVILCVCAEEASAWCSPCTKTIEKYCLNHLLNDHCCCDSGHTRGKFIVYKYWSHKYWVSNKW